MIQRRTLLGDGSAYSPAACERVVAEFKAAQAQLQSDAQAHTKVVQGVFAFEWELTPAEVVGHTPLPTLFPMAVSLYYQMPPSADGRAYEHLSSIQNLTLSAQ